MKPVFLLAPIRGVTDLLYRNLFTKYFGGFDYAVAPFIAASAQINAPRKLLRELDPLQDSLKTIPQILSGDPDDFIPLANALFDKGYGEVNWNLGCPHPVVVSKNRGSALLRYPALIDAFLDKTIPAIHGKLSVKLRLGFEYADDIFQLIPVFNRYPLAELIIHARTGKQMYDGITDTETFEKCIPLIKHPLVFNGDINTEVDFLKLSAQFPSITKWMIGRGVLRDPYLLQSFIGGHSVSSEDRSKILRQFHDALFDGYSQILSSHTHVLDKMKGHWFYLSDIFPEKGKLFKKINKLNNLHRYNEFINGIFSPDKSV